MTDDREPEPIPGQMTVEECIAEAERQRLEREAEGLIQPVDRKEYDVKRPMTAAEIVAARLKETE